MLVFLISVIVSTVPSILLYRWIKNYKDNDNYKDLCKRALKLGLFAVIPICFASLIFFIIGKVSHLEKINIILYQAYYTIIVLAFAEELVKYLCFKKVLKDTKYKYNYFDIVIAMSMVGLGFGIIENITFSINSGIISMIIKGIDLAHLGYGFIVGYFYAKAVKTKKNFYKYLGFIISWLLHGLYDFGLSDELLKINDNFAFLSVSLTLFSLITLGLFIRYVRCERKKV